MGMGGIGGLVFGGFGVPAVGALQTNRWYDTSTPQDTAALDASSWTEAELLLECTTIDLNGSVTGTALFEVKSSFPSDGFGKFMDVIARGASVAGMAVECSRAFPEVGSVGHEGGLLHPCRMRPTLCLANGGIRSVLHTCLFRTRTRASIREP